MSQKLLSISKIDVNKLTLDIPPVGDTKRTIKTGTFVKVKHDGRKENLRFLLPTMKTPLGARPRADYPDKISMMLSFQADNTPVGSKVKKANAKMLAIQDKIRSMMLENKEALFKDAKKKGVTDKTLIERFAKFVYSDEEKKYSDSMFVNLDPRRLTDDEKESLSPSDQAEIVNRFDSMRNHHFLVDNEDNAVDIHKKNVNEVIPPGSEVRAVIELSYIWVGNDGKFTCHWKVVHMLLVSTGAPQQFDIHRDDSSDDEAEEAEADDNMEVDGEEVENNAVESSAEEEEDEEEMAK